MKGPFCHLSLVKDFTELADTDLDWLDHELRTVIALQEADMQLGVFLRQEEGLSDFPVVEIGKIDAAVVVVVASAGQHDPVPVARPRGVAVGIVFAVDDREVEGRRGLPGKGRAGILVHRDTDDVGVMVPAVETSVLSQGKQQIAPVGADTGQGDTLVV